METIGTERLSESEGAPLSGKNCQVNASRSLNNHCDVRKTERCVSRTQDAKRAQDGQNGRPARPQRGPRREEE